MSEKNEKTGKEKPVARRRKMPSVAHSASDKAQAVLAVWTERVKPAEVCRQMEINWITFNQWQQRAMEGMLQALETRVNLSKGEALSPRLQTLLHQQQSRAGMTKLERRLAQLQENKNGVASKEVSAPKMS